ncbi:hypothetical protein [Streptomyces triticiradicis]|uniref:Uncharacterized protein n=1 Tax=Streptomyces triticiradicis TaxID=2651189 RepID=A0A7J5D652_9ACTN|nr:hypothetical protein [Streptomyces triticiradicis]KAB1979311.1 hypothetical protein F8144_36730 [Streptomyces triticiradicis]
MSATGTLLYSAELIQEGGAYKLVVTDRLRHTVQTAYVSRRAVEQLPVFLSKLDSPYQRGIRRR